MDLRRGALSGTTGQRVHVVDNFITLFQASVVNAMMERADCLMIVGDFNDRCWEGSHNTSDLGTKLLDLTNLLAILNTHQVSWI